MNRIDGSQNGRTVFEGVSAENILYSTHLHNDVDNGINDLLESIESSFGYHNILEVQAPILVRNS